MLDLNPEEHIGVNQAKKAAALVLYSEGKSLTNSTRGEKPLENERIVVYGDTREIYTVHGRSEKFAEEPEFYLKIQ